MSKEEDESKIKVLYEEYKENHNVQFILGSSVRAITATIVQPIDVIKIRIQFCIAVGLKTYPASLREIIAKEGISVLYSYYGISAGLLKQIMSATTRIGVYSQLFHYFTTEDCKFPCFANQVALEILAVACGAYVSTPAELALVRMTADTCIPTHQRKNYKHVVDALKRINRKEGVTSLWRGAVPMVIHGVATRSTGIVCYPLIQSKLMTHFNDGLPLRSVASMIVEFIATIVALPSDIVKTKLQGMKVTKGIPEYKGPLDVVTKIVNQESVFILWKGFIPYYVRRATQSVLTIIMLEYCYIILQKINL